LKLVHLLHPLGRLVVAIHEIAHGHHEIRVKQVRVFHRLREHFDSFRRPARAIAEDDEVKNVIAFGQRQNFRRTAAGMNVPLGRTGEHHTAHQEKSNHAEKIVLHDSHVPKAQMGGQAKIRWRA
jgi:hypothetical protein